MKIWIILCIASVVLFEPTNCKDNLKDKIKELEDCLSKLLASKHKLETLKKHLPANEMLSNMTIKASLDIIEDYIKDIRSRLELLYKVDGIMEHLKSELGGLESLFKKIRSKRNSTEISSTALYPSSTTLFPTASSTVINTFDSTSIFVEPSSSVPNMPMSSAIIPRTTQPPTTRPATTEGCYCTCPSNNITAINYTTAGNITEKICDPKVVKIAGFLIPNIKVLIQRFGDKVVEFLSENVLLEKVKIKLVGGGIWISMFFKGEVCSLYFHPTKTHHATTEIPVSLFTTNVKRIIAAPCEWAISCQDQTFGSDRTFYGVDD